MKPSSKILVCLLALAMLWQVSIAHAQSFPPLTGRVTDAASIIPSDVEARLTQKLETLETQSRHQLVVATIPNLQGYDIADYGYRLGREWGIGDKDRNDGVLLIVAPNERKVRIEVGYGLEPVLTDGLSSLIIANDIVPRFKAGDMPDGIEAGVDAIVTQLTLPPEQAQQIAQQASSQNYREPPVSAETFFFFLMIFMFMVVVPFFRTVYKHRRYPSLAGRAFIWDMLDNMPRGSGSSGGSSGGGFSGGGGSFGGGGASGSW